MAHLESHGDVLVLWLGETENKINPDLTESVNACLDEALAANEPRALVTCAQGKFFSTGLDLGWMAANQDRVSEAVDAMHQLFARMLELPMPTVAALNGHAFAGGGMFALAHDHRVMRADRGFFCLPEIDGQIPFTPGLSDLIAARLGAPLAHQAMTSGRRYSPEECGALGIVDALAPNDAVLDQAVELARSLAPKHGATYAAIRAGLHRRLIASLRDKDANAVSAEHFAAIFSPAA